MNEINDPEGWTPENNLHPIPSYMRLYTNHDGSHWSDYMEYYSNGKMICHKCIKRAENGSGNCCDGGEYFICVKEGRRKKLREQYEKKHEVQSKLI